MSTPDSNPAAVAAPRTDPNSVLAHEQLVAKTKAGVIDLYFVGDSITRRWGCTDPQYADLMENWRANFFGWNAANFAWGGDSTQHILWRLDHGELEGVNPKVIVILAGTNNLGGQSHSDALAADVTAGVEAIVRRCRDLAPEATIILMGILPRNDHTAVLPTIRQINANLETIADGQTVLYLNINDQLADDDGVLFEGMTMDGLHLAAPGYQVWADALRPILTDLLGPPADEDHAPPPTGDPSAAPPGE